jgi:hypothetical protein
VQLWLRKAQDKPLEQVQWEDGSHAPNHQAVKTPELVENQILDARKFLVEKSDLGEFGAEAIRTHLLEQPGCQDQLVPSVATINRILRRHGVFDARRRVRSKPPMPGWYLPDVATRNSDVDEVDFVEALFLEGGQELCALNLISLHGGWCASWLNDNMKVPFIMASLVSHWREFGLPAYAQFDNGNPFTGPRQHRDAIGRVILMCLSLDVTPVFAVPREFGIQSAIEGYNNQWQQKVWQRMHFDNVEEARKQSHRYVSAVRRKRSQRQQASPSRRVFPADWEYPTELHRQGQIIFLRRTTDKGTVELLGREYPVSANWCNRLVRCEVDLSGDQIRVYGLRRQAPEEQPLLKQWQYRLPDVGRKRHRKSEGPQSCDTIQIVQ